MRKLTSNRHIFLVIRSSWYFNTTEEIDAPFAAAWSGGWHKNQGDVLVEDGMKGTEEKMMYGEEMDRRCRVRAKIVI